MCHNISKENLSFHYEKTPLLFHVPCFLATSWIKTGFLAGFYVIMGTQKLFLMKTHFSFVYKYMIFFVKFMWVSFISSLFTLFSVIRQNAFRLQEKVFTHKKNMSSEVIQPYEDHIPANLIEEVKDDESESLLRFHFPTYEEFIRNKEGNSVSCDNSDDNFDHVEAKGSVDCDQNGLIANSADKFSSLEEIGETQISSENVNDSSDGYEEYVERLHFVGNVAEECYDISDSVGGVGKDSEDMSVENVESASRIADNLRRAAHIMRCRTQFLSDDESLVSDSDSDSLVSSSKSSFRSSFIDSFSDGFLSDIDFERAFEVDISKEFGWEEVKASDEVLTKEDIELRNLSKGYGSDDELENEDEDILDELTNLESDVRDEIGSSDAEQHSENLVLDEQNESNSEDTSSFHSEEHKLESNLADVNDTTAAEGGASRDTEPESTQNVEKTSSGEQLSSDSEEQNALEKEWEHQDLVEQLKMEIKRVRAIGLPTILEDSESPKIMDDLKPWKIEGKYQHEGTLDELHKFYKSYRDRMRKLDILNYQKMYAIGFLKLKDPLQSFTKNKISTPALATIVSIDCWPCKPKTSSEVHQPVMKKFTRELESELEMVYVSQMCLSWEFLRWEYGKALDLWESDPQGVRRYNDVAGKFQTFQVLLTRFLEDEPFQGPRVQHYVKNRCVFRNFLQVPVIRDDSYRDRNKEKNLVSSKDAIISLQLVEIIEESIRILWQFIRSDKERSNAVLVKCRKGVNVELLNPADASLLAEVRSSLHKKDKKLRELSRTENCVLRNFRKHQEDGSDSVLHFFSRVDLRLVTRVLNMSRISTEQLLWCRDKLNQINFDGRKLHVEPSVLLFPCS